MVIERRNHAIAIPAAELRLLQSVLCQTIGISTKTYAALIRGECNRLDVFLALIDHLCKGRGEVIGLWVKEYG